MKAWHVQEKDGENQEIIFADTRGEAIQKSEAAMWENYIDVRAKRAKYADGLNMNPVKLMEAQLENGWWLECHNEKCSRQITEEDTYTIVDAYIYCEDHSDSFYLGLTTGQKLKKHMDENGEDYYSQFSK